MIELVPAYGRNDANLHRDGEGGSNATSVQRRSAGPRGRPETNGVRNFECRSDEYAGPPEDGQWTVVPGRIGKAGEGGAIATGQLMRDRGGCRVVPMRDMRDRVQREGDQQPCEHNSQPLRKSSGQLEGAHDRQTPETFHRLRQRAPVCKAGHRFRELRPEPVQLPAGHDPPTMPADHPEKMTLSRRTPRLLPCIALGLALILAQAGALFHSSSHGGATPDHPGLHSQLCDACLSFSTIFSMSGGPGTAHVLPNPVIAFTLVAAIVSLVERQALRPFQSRAPPRS